MRSEFEPCCLAIGHWMMRELTSLDSITWGYVEGGRPDGWPSHRAPAWVWYRPPAAYSLTCGAPLISRTMTVAQGSGAVVGNEIVVPLRDSTFKRVEDLPKT